MGTQTSSILNATTFPGLFQASLKQWGIGFLPAGVRVPSAQSERTEITWSSDSRYSVAAESSPLLRIPLLSQRPAPLQDPVDLIRRYLSAPPAPESSRGAPSLATTFQMLQEEIPRMDAVARLAADDPKSLSRAAYVLRKASARHAITRGPDAGALLQELSTAIASYRYHRFEAPIDAEETHRKTLVGQYHTMIDAQLRALPSQLDQAFDAVRIFAGLRACLALDDEVGRMIPFLIRYERLLSASADPQTTGEHRLRLAWFVLQHARTVQDGAATAPWKFAAEQIDAAIALWTGDSARAEQTEKLRWFLSGTLAIAGRRSRPLHSGI